MVVSVELIISLQVCLSVFCSLFEDDASFRVVIGECVDSCKPVGCTLLTTQGLSRGI